MGTSNLSTNTVWSPYKFNMKKVSAPVPNLLNIGISNYDTNIGTAPDERITLMTLIKENPPCAWLKSLK